MLVKVLLLSAVVAVTVARNDGPVAEEIEAHPSQPYAFSYNTDDEFGNTHFHKETSDGKGRVEGSYGYRDNHGTERVVQYVADEHGYRAQVKTNEPGTDGDDPANAEFLIAQIEPRLAALNRRIPQVNKAPPHTSTTEKVSPQSQPQRLPAFPLHQHRVAHLRVQQQPASARSGRASSSRRSNQQAILRNAAVLGPLAHIIF